MYTQICQRVERLSLTAVYHVQRALDLPPLHIFGLSIGSSVALEVATAHPEGVLSLTLCSPLPSIEVSIYTSNYHRNGISILRQPAHAC